MNGRKNDANGFKKLSKANKEKCELKTPNVCLPSDGSLISQPRQVEVLQDTSQSSLEQYIRTQYPTQPTRFGKLLLMLSSLRKVEPTVIEQLFFADVLRGASMGDVLRKMLTNGVTNPTSLAALANKGT